MLEGKTVIVTGAAKGIGKAIAIAFAKEGCNIAVSYTHLIDMDVRNCKNCGKLFQYVGKPLCPACNKKLEDKFFEVRDYIYENPTANMSQVSEEMEVPIQQIKKLSLIHISAMYFKRNIHDRNGEAL